MSGISVRDVEGGEVSAHGALVLQEKRSYVVEARGAREIRLGGRVLQRSGDTGWLLPVEFWAGRTELAVDYPGGTQAHGVHVLPDPSKVSAGAWESILADLEDLLPGVTHGAQGGEAGTVGPEGLPLPLLTQALLPLVPSLLVSLRAIVSEPRLHTVEEPNEIPLYRVRRVEREVITWLSRHPSASIELGIVGNGGRSQAAVPNHETRNVLEHPANCYVAWLTWRVARALDQCASRWAIRPGADEDERAWCEARSSDCRLAATSLGAVVRSSFLQSIPRAPASDAALLVAIDDPRYARFQRQARRFLHPLFDPSNSDAPGAPLRPTFDIYELWSFLAVARSIREAFPDATVSDQGLRSLLVGTGAGAKYSFQFSSGRQLEVEFNLTFPSQWARGPTARRFSISGQRRPDIVLSAMGGDGPPVWLPLDAKYRVERDAVGRSFESVHIYRDSLRDIGRGGACAHAALLAPAITAESAPWFAQEFIDEFLCGVFEVVPGGTGMGRLVQWLARALRLA